MNDQDNLTKQILLTTKKIQEEFPELIKYLEEMPIDIQHNTDNNVNHKGQKDYLDSLNNLLESYTKDH